MKRKNIDNAGSVNKKLAISTKPRDENNLVEATRYLIDEGKKSSQKEIDKLQVIGSINVLRPFAQNGLNWEVLKNLLNVAFNSCLPIKCRCLILLHCIPKTKKDFDLVYLPYAVSLAISQEIPKTVRTSIFMWLSGLFEYKVVESNHFLVSSVYQPIFHRLSDPKLCPIITKVVCLTTQLHHVTDARIQFLLRLIRKPTLKLYIIHVLKTFQTFRPDLLNFFHSKAKSVPKLPKDYDQYLTSAVERWNIDLDELDENEKLWPKPNLHVKLNPYKEKTCLRAPELFIYAEPKRRKQFISVLQYQSMDQMIKCMPKSDLWEYPNSPAALLWKPAIIAFFKPLDFSLNISICDYLEHLLRAELIEGRHNASEERRKSIWSLTLNLLQQNGSSFSNVFKSLQEIIQEWDGVTDLKFVLNFSSLLMHDSEIDVTSVTVKLIEVMSRTPLSVEWCEVVDALCEQAITWALHYHKNSKLKGVTVVKENDYSLNSILELVEGTEMNFIAAFNQYRCHKLLVRSCISFYERINDILDRLKLPIFVFPPFEVSLKITLFADRFALQHFEDLVFKAIDVCEKVKNMDLVSQVEIDAKKLSIEIFYQNLQMGNILVNEVINGENVDKASVLTLISNELPAIDDGSEL